MNFMIRSATLIMVLACLCVPTVSQAQFARNSGAPIDASADDIVSADGITTLKGQVDVRQANTRILADQMKIYSGGSGVVGATSEISRIEAIGNFYYITPDQEVKGNKGVYTQSDDSFVVTGDVILLQGENIVTGERLIYNLTTEQARVVGTCKGRRCGKNGRVNILIKNTRSSNPS